MSLVYYPFGTLAIAIILVSIYIYLRQRGRLGGQRNIFFLALIFFFAFAFLVTILQWYTPWF